MTVSELINKLQEIQKEYPNLYLSPKNELIEKPYRRKDKYFISFTEERSALEKELAYEYAKSWR